MTYKILGILKRPDGMTFEEFKKWWVEVHVPRVMKWPGIVARFTTRLRRSREGLPIHAGLLPASMVNHIYTDLGILRVL
jgi:EthD domain